MDPAVRKARLQVELLPQALLALAPALLPHEGPDLHVPGWDQPLGDEFFPEEAYIENGRLVLDADHPEFIDHVGGQSPGLILRRGPTCQRSHSSVPSFACRACR
jgi:hypothetical protein